MGNTLANAVKSAEIYNHAAAQMLHYYYTNIKLGQMLFKFEALEKSGEFDFYMYNMYLSSIARLREIVEQTSFILN